MHETVRFTILLVLETLRFTILLVLETVMIWSLVCSRVMCMFIEGRGLRTAASVDQNRSSACLCLHARINPNVVRSFVRSFVRFFLRERCSAIERFWQFLAILFLTRGDSQSRCDRDCKHRLMFILHSKRCLYSRSSWCC